MKKNKLVLIEWLDSHSGDGWKTIERFDAVAEPLYCRSVGWILSENKNCKVIVPHVAGERQGQILLQGCGDLTIPTKAILKVTVLREN